MPHPLRFAPALAGALILAAMLSGLGSPVDTLCKLAPQPLWLASHCLALAPGPLTMAVAGDRPDRVNLAAADAVAARTARGQL